MKLQLFIPALLLLSLTVSAQNTPPVIEWQKSFGGSYTDQAYSIKQLKNGEFIISGLTYSNDFDIYGNHGISDFWVIKLNNLGDTIWTKTLGGSDDDRSYSVEQTIDNGFIIGGFSKSNDGDVNQNYGETDCWIVKLDSLGNIMWENSFGGTFFDGIYKIRQTLDSGYIAIGYSSSNDGNISGNHGNNDVLVIKIDNLGNIQWIKSLGGTEAEIANDVKQTTDGGFVIAGWSLSNDGDVSFNQGNHDYWVIKLNSVGNIQWQHSYGGTGEDDATSIIETTNNNYFVVGYSESNDGDVTGNHGSYDIWVIKIDSIGNLLWQKCFGDNTWDIAMEVNQTNDDGLIIAGYSQSLNGDNDYLILKTDSLGNLIWQKILGGTYFDEAFSIEQTQDGSYIVGGSSQSNDGDVSYNQGAYDFWIVKLSPDTNSAIKTPVLRNHCQIFPNPNTGTFTITGKDIQAICVTDVNGKIVLQVAEDRITKVNHLSLGKKIQGVYFVKVFTGKQVVIQKMVVE